MSRQRHLQRRHARGRSIEVHGIEASQAMLAKLKAKPGGDRISVTVGSFADFSLQTRFRLVGIGSNLDAAEAYDAAAGRWDRLPDMPTARGGIAAAAAANGYVVAAGGEADAAFGEAEAFDIQAGLWLSLPEMPTPRHGLGVVAVGSVVYAIAGGTEPELSVSDATEAIDLTPLRS